MSAPVSPIEAWQMMQDGLAGMIGAEAKMNADPDGCFEPDFDTSATQAMDGFQALLKHPDTLASVLRALVIDPDTISIEGTFS